MSPFLPNRMKEHWGEVRTFLKREWPRLTETDLDRIDGEYDRLITRVRAAYGGPDPITMEAEIKGKVKRFLNRLEGVS